jgi:hypothetical protein
MSAMVNPSGATASADTAERTLRIRTLLRSTPPTRAAPIFEATGSSSRKPSGKKPMSTQSSMVVNRSTMAARREQRFQEPALQLGEEDGDPDAVRGGGVGVGARNALDQPVQAQAPQVVAHLVGAVVRPEESGNPPAKALVGEAGDGVDLQAKGAGQGHGAWVPEAKSPGSLALPYVGLVDAL